MGNNRHEISNADYNKYFERCRRFAFSYTRNAVDAESIASEALTFYVLKLREGAEIVQVLPFLFSFVRNKCLQLLRNKKIHIQTQKKIHEELIREMDLRINSLEACDPHILFEADVQNLIESTLQSLSPKTREIFMLSRFQGCSNTEIASHFGLSEKSVEYHITKSLKAFRISLKDYLPAIAIFLSI